jgi:hypothetical protein
MMVKIRVMREDGMGNDGQKVLTVVELSRLGNIARTKKLSTERRKEIAQLAAKARWAKKPDAPDPNDPKKGPKDGPDLVLCKIRKPCRQTGVPLTQPTLFEFSEAA